MDATTDPDRGFNGEAEEDPSEDTSGELVELVDDGDSGPAQEGAVTRSSTRSGLVDGSLSEGELALALADALLPEAARYARWQGRRPPVSHLAPGVVFPPGESACLPLFDVGDRVVVEQRSTMLQPRPDPLCPLGTVRCPWLRTVVGRVQAIDDEAGTVTVVPEGQDARWVHVAHFSTRDPENTAFFLAPSLRGDPFDAGAVLAARREEQRRAAQLASAASAGGPAPQKRGRGRPKGSLNRPKDVIRAEKEQIAKIRTEKRALRSARRGVAA